MNTDNIKNILEHISDSNIKYFIKALNLDKIDNESKLSVLDDLWTILEYSRDKIDKDRVTKYIDKINSMKEEEILEKKEEINDLELNFNY